MGIIAYPRKLPAPKQVVANDDGSVTNDYRYLLLALYNATGQGDGVPSVDSGPNGTGAIVSATAPYVIAADWTLFVTVPVGGQAQLPNLPVGCDAIIFNDDGAHALGVLPQSTVQIDALGLGNAYSLAHAKMQWFRQVTPTLIHSMQLG